MAIMTHLYGLAIKRVNTIDPYESEEDMHSQQLKAMLASKTQAAEKAAMALVALRATRPEGVKGVGPNKDDLPVFVALTNARLQGRTPDKDLLYQVQVRVSKYSRQVAASPYAAQVTEDTHKVVDFANSINDTIKAWVADRELQSYLKAQEQSAYGEW
jgi:hypothetical protein